MLFRQAYSIIIMKGIVCFPVCVQFTAKSITQRSLKMYIQCRWKGSVCTSKLIFKMQPLKG